MEDKEKLTKEYEIGVLVRKEEDLPAVRRIVEQHDGRVTADFRPRKWRSHIQSKKRKKRYLHSAFFPRNRRT